MDYVEQTLRILYFSQDYSTHDHRFLTSLANTNHEISFLRLENQGQLLEKRSLPNSVDLITWKGGKTKYRTKNILIYLSSLKKVINKAKPDIIHAGPIQNSAFLVSLLNFHPLVTMSWGSDLLIDAEKSYIMKKITRYTLKRSTVMIADCEAAVNQAVKFGFLKDRIVTFPWGIDLNHFNTMKDNSIRDELGWEDNFVIV